VFWFSDGHGHGLSGWAEEPAGTVLVDMLKAERKVCQRLSAPWRHWERLSRTEYVSRWLGS
jgi:hypothetical protein